MNGRQLSRYRLLEQVGQGGMAVVYKATDTTLNREVAVKILHPHLAGQEESRARLQREAHAVAKLRHENILEIFDYSGPDSQESYIVTEFIHGKTLKIFVTEHPLPFPEVAEMIASEVARALEHAHTLGVIHRDVKPENVMIRDDGLIKLTDFGIAQIVDKERMTVTGQLLGSPAYMAPEHIEGRALDFRTDVFAVGILTYQLATGQLPFRGKNPHEVLKRIAECKFAPPESVQPLVGKRLGRIIAKALARDPDNRFADIAALRAELCDDLADAGVEDARKELAAFFADPARFARDFHPRLVAALTARGKARAAAGRTAAALELWGRALAYEPKSAELRALVDGVAARASRARMFRVAGVVALGGVVAAGAGVALRRVVRPGPAAVAPRLSSHDETATPPSSRPPAIVVTAPAPTRETHKAARHAFRPPPNAEAKRDFELAPTPKAVTVFLDGERVGDYGPQLARLSLGPGRHVVRFESPYCFAKEVSVEESQPAGSLRAHLDFKPARLTIKAEPEAADVLVEDQILRSGQPLEVKIGGEGRKSVTVKVSAAGYASKQLTVELRANEQRSAEVALERVAAP